MGIEPEIPPGAFYVQLATWLSVRLAPIPDDPAREAGSRCDTVDQLADGDLIGRPDVDRVRPVVAFGGQHDGAGRVIHIEEFARWPPRAPDSDGWQSLLTGLHAFAD